MARSSESLPPPIVRGDNHPQARQDSGANPCPRCSISRRAAAARWNKLAQFKPNSGVHSANPHSYRPLKGPFLKTNQCQIAVTFAGASADCGRRPNSLAFLGCLRGGGCSVGWNSYEFQYCLEPTSTAVHPPPPTHTHFSSAAARARALHHP